MIIIKNSGMILMKKIRKIQIAVLILLIIFSPPVSLLRSMVVLSAYSAYNLKNSIMEKEGFEIKIPGGLSTKETDWYPFVSTFNDNAGIRNFTDNKDLSLTIMYNFPSYSLLRGCSRIFDPNSRYSSGFYGAYAVQDEDGIYGFNDDGSIDLEAASQIPQFDMQRLVLGAMGLEYNDMVFNWDIVRTENNINYADSEGWSVIDSVLTVNSVCHNYKNFSISYLQYGMPNFEVNNDFTPINMYGRVYAKYFKEYNCSIFFYIIVPDKNVLENCDKNILSKSRIYSR